MNSNKLSQSEFEKRLNDLYHGDIIALDPYINAKTPIHFYCKVKNEDGTDHGIFQKTPYEVINLKRGCNICKGIENVKPFGFWNIYEHCLEEAKKYHNKWDLQQNNVSCYQALRRNGWLEDIEKLYDNSIHYEDFSNKVHLIYVYEINDLNTCYVGRTKNLKRRDKQHRNGGHHKGEKVYDALYNFCLNNNIQIPNPKILIGDLNAIESQEQEDFYVKYYKEQGWYVLNSAPTGKNVGSLGAILKWNYENCKNEAEKYSSKYEMKCKCQPAYSSAVRNKWIDEFFVNKKKNDGYWHSEENIRNAAKQCKGARDLIKRFGGAYNAAKKLNILKDLEYGKNL